MTVMSRVIPQNNCYQDPRVVHKSKRDKTTEEGAGKGYLLYPIAWKILSADDMVRLLEGRGEEGEAR